MVLPECMARSMRFGQVVSEVKRGDVVREEWEVNM
jgi:hypothetical protein